MLQQMTIVPYGMRIHMLLVGKLAVFFFFFLIFPQVKGYAHKDELTEKMYN